MGIRSCAVAAVLTGSLALSQGAAVGRERPDAPRQAVDGRAAIEDPARLAVVDAFYDVWLRNQLIPVGWTGAVDVCEPGSVSEATRQATQSQINYFRGLAGLRRVTLATDLSKVAQRTALIMDANDQLSHDPPGSWRCHTAAGGELAGRSNLALGVEGTGARAITRYVEDSAHTGVGHRRWVLNPRTSQMAAGSTHEANALVVVGMPQHDFRVPAWIPWPPAGYFPAPLEPRGVWSLSAGRAGVDFSRARIRVTDAAGTSYDVTRFPPTWVGGPTTLVWRVAGLKAPTFSVDRTYRVRVSRIQRRGELIPAVTWRVTLVKPDRSLRVVEQPVVRGTVEVGSQLTASGGTWSPTPSTVSYRWTRDGQEILGATNPFYTLAPADEGHVVSVVVAATAPYYAPGRFEVGGLRVAGG
jgi:uncharacterized protein YkwD